MAVFSPFGKIIDIVAMKTKTLRGQAWVVFAEPAAAAASLRQMQGFPFYDKPMRLQFSKKPSKKAVQSLGEAGRQSAAANASALAEAAAVAALAPVATTSAGTTSALLVRSVPPEVTLEMLTALFSQYGQASATSGSLPGSVVVQFADEGSATRAFQNLQGFRVSPTYQLQLEYTAAVQAAPTGAEMEA
jgi:U2 small nuclear ribonucleoprotein B''